MQAILYCLPIVLHECLEGINVLYFCMEDIHQNTEKELQEICFRSLVCKGL